MSRKQGDHATERAGTNTQSISGGVIDWGGLQPLMQTDLSRTYQAREVWQGAPRGFEEGCDWCCGQCRVLHRLAVNPFRLGAALGMVS